MYTVQCPPLSHPDPNDYSVFQPGAALHDLSSKLLVYYHPKACSATTVYDLSPASVKGKGASAEINGGCYVAFRLKVNMRPAFICISYTCMYVCVLVVMKAGFLGHS